MPNITDVPALQPQTRELTFIEKGLLGFESLLKFELSVYDPETPFYWLRSKDNPDVAFIVMEPSWILSDYDFELGDEEARLLGIETDRDVFVLVLCTIPENPTDMTANLLGPLVFHRDSHRGLQLILDRNRYPLRHPVFQADESDEPV